MGNSDDESQDPLWLAEQRVQLSLYAESEKNSMEIQKKMQLADISEEKELQRTIISFSAGGEAILQKEQFGKNIQGKLPVKILAARLFAHLDDIEASVLSVILENENGRECCLFWNIRNLETRQIRIPFEKNGIMFGFGEKKENEIRKKFLAAMINIAKIMVLPERHGWYQVNGKWNYAFPEAMTWKEVEENC